MVDHGAKLIEPELDERFDTVLEWADELGASACGSTPTPPRTRSVPASSGAEGIGLCRTEHMFMAEDRQPKMRAMIMARDDRGAPGRPGGAAAAPGGGLHRDLRRDAGPAGDDPAARPAAARVPAQPARPAAPSVERARLEEDDDLEELETLLSRVEEIHEGNPMLGTRGVRLGILYPEIYEMQAHAIMRAAKAVDERPHPEIMIPLVAYEHEIEIMRELVVRVGNEHEPEGGRRLHRRAR